MEIQELDNTQEMIIGRCSKMQSIIKTIDRIKNIDSTILISGESGTGKSMIAKYIHNRSHRCNKPFITVNCSTIPANLMESEFFGYSSGAFTGANKSGKIGLVEASDGGTLFLDEIGEIPLNIQVKFLELVQEKSFTPVGSTNKKHADIRIISATNASLIDMIKEKIFREDLYYRLNVVKFNIPPLRERSEDIERLINYYLKKFTYKYNMPHILTKESRQVLNHYSWPGNIRELQHTIEQLVVSVANHIIQPSDLPDNILKESESATGFIYETLPKFDEAIMELERTLILKAFSQYGSSYKVAEVLGISQSKAIRLYRKYYSER